MTRLEETRHVLIDKGGIGTQVLMNSDQKVPTIIRVLLTQSFACCGDALARRTGYDQCAGSKELAEVATRGLWKHGTQVVNSMADLSSYIERVTREWYTFAEELCVDF